jgi:hypothetical protein
MVRRGSTRRGRTDAPFDPLAGHAPVETPHLVHERDKLTMLKSILTAATTLAIASTAFAQGASYYIPSNTPTTGNCNVIPFGLGSSRASATWSNQRYQCMATASQLGNSVLLDICDLAFASCVTGVKHFDTIEIVLGQTKATTLSTTFSANLVSNVQTVLSAKNYDWYRNAGTWDRIGFDKSYLYLAANGKNLVIQITVTGARGLKSFGNGNHVATGQQRVYRFRWTGAPPTTGSTDRAALKFEVVSQKADLHRFGHGCPGSNSKTPALAFTGTAQLGGTMSINVSNCLATAPTLHVVGVTRNPSGIDLGFIGAAGCNLYQSTDIILPQITDTAGKYAMKITVPKDRNLVCFRIYTQAFPADRRANNWGRSSTNYGRILPGF